MTCVIGCVSYLVTGVTDYVFLIWCVINHAFFHLVTGVIDYAFLLVELMLNVLRCHLTY